MNPEGNAIIYCEGAFLSTNGKTAHGLVRRSRRYRILSVIDSTCAGTDARLLLDGVVGDIPVVQSLRAALAEAEATGSQATHLVIGLAPEGGRLPPKARLAVQEAIAARLNVDSGLHDFLSEDPTICDLARQHRVRLRDIRKPPPRSELHFFSGKIEEVDALKVAVLGTDSAVGKRTTAWLLVDALRAGGHETAMVGTGQTAWLQGAEHCIILDSIINDFLTGEIEHVVWSAWRDRSPEVIVIEGQGSLLNPAYPGGYEILAAARPDAIILQHAVGRSEYDGFPGYPLHRLERQIAALEMVSGKPVIAITINRGELAPAKVPKVIEEIEQRHGLPAIDVLEEGAGRLVGVLDQYLRAGVTPAA